MFAELATFEVDRGIDDRLWGPAPEQSSDEPDDSTVGTDVEAALAAAGIETTDLFALDNDSGDDDSPATPVEPRPKARQRRAAKAGRRSGGLS